MTKELKITFIQTGGTIDKDYPHISGGRAFDFGEPATERILEKLNPSFEYEVLTSCQKDSLDITDEDRNDLVLTIQKSTEDKFIVTHGTDTIIESAKYLGERVRDKLIIFTGAMLPERFSNSEASINVGAAIAAANLLSEGIYISMHGIVKEYSEIKRDLETGKFY